MKSGTDTDFLPAIIRAGEMIPEDIATAGQELADILRSDMQIGTVERELLAQLLTGEWSRDHGNQGWNYSKILFAIKVSEFFKLRTQRDRIKKAAVYQECNEIFGVSATTVRNYVKLHDERLEAGITDCPDMEVSVAAHPRNTS